MLMPEFDGFQFLEALKKKGTNIPVIVLTADIQDTSEERCKRSGQNDF